MLISDAMIFFFFYYALNSVYANSIRGIVIFFSNNLIFFYLFISY